MPSHRSSTPRDFRLGSGAVIRSSTATWKFLPWLLASANLIAAADAHQHAAADNIYPSLTGQPRTFMPPSLADVRAPVDKIGDLRGNAPPITTTKFGDAIFGTARKRIQLFTAMIWSVAIIVAGICVFHILENP